MFRSVLFVAITLTAVGPAAAGFLVAPNAAAGAEQDRELAFPFNLGAFPTNVQSMRYQQVYNASNFGAFDGPQLITDIRFRTDANPGATAGGPFNSVLPSVRIDLSTTVRTAATLSPTFADNVGPDNTTVSSGPLALSSTATGPGPRAFDVVIPLAAPFLYDPAAGSLLLDVRNFGGGTTSFFDALSGSTESRRVFSLGNSAGVDSPTGFVETFFSITLVTGFTFEPAGTPVVPLPPAAVVFAAGAVGLGLARRRAS